MSLEGTLGASDGGNRFFVLTEDLEPWVLGSPPPVDWPDCRYFGDMLQAVNAKLPNRGLSFILTKRVTESLPLHGDNVVVVCLGDELCRTPSYAHDVRLVAKTYGVQRTPNVLKGTWRSPSALGATVTQELIVQARRAPSHVRSFLRSVRRQRRPLVIDIPLGTYLLADVPFVPFRQRPFDVSYAGSRFNRGKEAGRRVPTQKARSRLELETVLQQLSTLRPDLEVATHVIQEFSEAAAHSEVYSRMLMDSRVTLCPRGGSLETYRFFEALQCGCVPISERLPHREYYTGAPGLRVERWTELPVVLDHLLGNERALLRMHEGALTWWAERCSPEAVARRLVAHLSRFP